MPTPGVIEYPTALDTALSLIEVANNGSSTLTANISVGDLLIPVAQPGKFTNSGIATLTDSLTTPTKIEIFLYTSKSGNNLVVPVGGRGAQGTTAQAFSTGNFVEQRPTARHHTALADVIMAIQAKLGLGANTPGGSAQALFSDTTNASVWRAIAQGDISGLAAALADKISKTDGSEQTVVSNLKISKGTPQLKWTHTGLSKNYIALVNGVGQLVIGEEGISNAITIDPITGLVIFEEVPLGPAADPPTANHLTRRNYVDTRHNRWSANWFIADPSTFPLNSFNLIQKVFIPGANFTVVQIGYIYNTGTASGSFDIQMRRHPPTDQTNQTVLGTITVNPGAVGVSGTVDIADATFLSGDYLYPVLTARSNPLQRDVSLFAWGFQTPQQVA